MRNTATGKTLTVDCSERPRFYISPGGHTMNAPALASRPITQNAKVAPVALAVAAQR